MTLRNVNDAPMLPSTASYDEVLALYLRERNEEALYRATLLSQGFIEGGLGPEDIIALHFEALERCMDGMSYREQARSVSDAHQFLLEVMIAYGVKYKEYLELRLAETTREAEIRAEEARQRVIEAEEANQQKAEMLGLIAHELRTPLTAAVGNLYLAVRSYRRGQLERIPPLLGSAKDALGRLTRLTANLVEASRGAPPDLQRAPMRLDEVLEQSCTWARAAARSKDIDLRTEWCDEGALILGNTDALLSLFGNLLSNAIRYTGNGGRVSITTSVRNDGVEIAVTDTGIGISDDAKAHLFERFYRAPEARRTDARGLGLGLALVRDMVIAHDGLIELESTEGQGSTFKVWLPRLGVRQHA